jgi:hypothetical protein
VAAQADSFARGCGHARRGYTTSPDKGAGFRAFLFAASEARVPCNADIVVRVSGRLESLKARASARAGVLDPLDANLAEGPEEYFQPIEQLGASFAECLR